MFHGIWGLLVFNRIDFPACGFYYKSIYILYNSWRTLPNIYSTPASTFIIFWFYVNWYLLIERLTERIYNKYCLIPWSLFALCLFHFIFIFCINNVCFKFRYIFFLFCPIFHNCSVSFIDFCWKYRYSGKRKIVSN